MSEPLTTIEDMVECAERELRMRRSAYPRFIESGKLKPEAASHEIRTMAAIVEYLKAERDTPDAMPPLDRRPPPAQGSLL